MDPLEDVRLKSPFSDPIHRGIPMPMSIPDWTHVPPQTMPWGLPNSVHPSVVRFTGGDHPQMPFSGHDLRKRKFEFPVDCPPTKQLITEDKMAAHMSKLQITEQRQADTEPVMDMCTEQLKMPKLVVCDELKRLQQEPLIPQAILNKLERPKMALVLWQPPAGQLHLHLKDSAQRAEAEEEEEEKKKKEREAETCMMESEDVDMNLNVFRPIDPVYARPPFPFS